MSKTFTTMSEDEFNTFISRGEDKISLQNFLALEERVRAVEVWAKQPRPSAPSLSDEAISRASIYDEREDKQL